MQSTRLSRLKDELQHAIYELEDIKRAGLLAHSEEVMVAQDLVRELEDEIEEMEGEG